MTSSTFDSLAVASAHRVQRLARLVQVSAAVLAGLSLVGAVVLASVRVGGQDCISVELAGLKPVCPDHGHRHVGIAVVGEIALLFALLVVVLAAQYASFEAERYLAQAERSTDRATS